jgi:hypothetical protein
MFAWLLEYIFACSHDRTTWPQTTRLSRTHVTCIDCGREFLYDSANMRRGPEIKNPNHTPRHASALAPPLGING